MGESFCFVVKHCFKALVFALFLINTSESWVPSNSSRALSKSRLKSPLEMSSTNKGIYGIPGASWTSPTWNWGYAQGTGHDCAGICRGKYSSIEDRQALVDNLLKIDIGDEPFVDVEELKLILGLAFQSGRWDGSDGGIGGYGSVLSMIAEAKRYEDESQTVSHGRLMMDLADRFPKVLDWSRPTEGVRKTLEESMQSCIRIPDVTVGLQRCCGLVFLAMGFVQKGL